MKERISRILDHFNLSSSRLADMLGIQRSGISHILSGRNNPSYDFLVKLLENFPEINANWLLLGQGNMLIHGQGEDIQSPDTDQDKNTPEVLPGNLFDPKGGSRSETKVKSEDTPVYKSNQENSESPEIEKVITLYKNGKFRVYHSE